MIKKPIFEKLIYKNDNFKYNFTEWIYKLSFYLNLFVFH